ncbi:MAG TPA: PepSY domain-containing protein [Ottowia sp.]|uniref:PepSY domain-containing protein n=1 Tax=Ottowia sp. TaxID=1898956 RepID=UPI002BA94EA0|nr:PepSY domain-containing protein [Ottowia sp.]HMN21380.1 PepSY domain-containing protein [Ottowia sp.]
MTAPAIRHLRHLALLGLLAGALAVGAPLQAEPSDHDLARQALEQGQVLPLRTVLDKVERDYQGQVLKIEFEHEDGRFIYEIRLLQHDGHLAKLEVDATSGEVLKVKRKRR